MRSIIVPVFLSCCWVLALQITAVSCHGLKAVVAETPHRIIRENVREERRAASGTGAEGGRESKSTSCVVEVPANVSGVQRQDSGVVLTWSAPVSHAECDVAKYVVNSSTNVLWSSTAFSNVTEVNAKDALRYVITNPVPHSKYSFEVWAETSSGEFGGAAQFDVVTKEDVPSAPVDFRITNEFSNVLNLAWKAPEQANGDILNYALRWFTSDAEVGSANTTYVSYTIGGLEPCTVYTVTVAAVNAAGKGDEATTEGATLFKELENATCTQDKTDMSLHVTWRETGCVIDNFDISSVTTVLWSQETFTNSTVIGGSETEYVIDKPASLSFYSFEVQAVTDEINIGKPMTCNIATSQTAPGPPANLTLLEATSSSLFIQWEQPTDENGIIISYLVSWSSQSSGTNGSAEVAARQHVLLYQFYISNLDPGTDYEVKVEATTGQVGAPAQAVFSTLASDEVPATDAESQLSTGAVVGIAIGTLMGILLLVALVISCTKKDVISLRVPAPTTGTSHVNLNSGPLEIHRVTVNKAKNESLRI